VQDELKIEIENVEGVSDDNAMCIVRCLAGTVNPGAAFKRAELRSGETVSVDLRVEKILRYGFETDILDPPHSAKIVIVCPSPRAVYDYRYIYS
jgi:hypothetical protein